MGSTTHVDEEKRELAKDVHKLTRLGVIISVRSEREAEPIPYFALFGGECSYAKSIGF